MAVPCAALNALLFLSALRSPVPALLLGTLLLGPGLPLPALLLVWLLPLLLSGVRLLPTLLRLLLSLLLCGSRLLLSALLLSGLRPLLWLRVRLLPVLLWLLLSMLLCGLPLRGLGLLLSGMVLFFALVLCIGRARGSEKQRQHCRADDSSYFHKFCLLILQAALRDSV
jgi:hypothetical protein